MRITQDILIEIAREYVEEHNSLNDDLIAAYLTGSVLSKTPLLGETTDIDIVLIKEIESETREIIKLSPDIHLDVVTHPKKYYQPPKSVRLHPYLGYAINHCMPLMDAFHFIDFTQAGVRSGFDAPKNRFERAFPLLKEARKNWLKIEMNNSISIQEMVSIYLDALNLLSQSFAILHKGPIPLRNFFPTLRNISESNSFPALHVGMMGLIGGNQIDAEILSSWQTDWGQYLSLIEDKHDCPPEFYSAKNHYYQRAVSALVETDSPIDGLWILITTWIKAQNKFPKIPSNLEEYLHILGFTKETLSNKQKGLDALLDLMEEWFDDWKYEFGV